MKQSTLDLEEIITLWGSVEAYNEEQRRTGLAELEARPFEGQDKIPFQLPFFKNRPPSGPYFRRKTLKDGTPVTIRPLTAEDEDLMVRFHKSLSDSSVYYRWMSPLPLDLRLERLKTELQHPHDFSQGVELVADTWNTETGSHQIIGVGSLSGLAETNEADLGIVISDPYKRQGLGTEFMNRLVEVGKDRHLERISGMIHLENRPMLQLCRKLGLLLQVSFEDRLAKVMIDL